MNVLDWCQQASVGDRVVYHEGTESPPRDVSTAANAASAGGLVFLAQRRRWPGVGFAYEATRISAATARALGLVRERRVAA